MAKKRRIVILDDESEVRSDWKRNLLDIASVSRAFEVDIMIEGEFREAWEILNRRYIGSGKGAFESTAFDTSDIVIVDYDLRYMSAEPSFLTGETIAYMARCYSRCGIIVTVNQFGGNPFDLTLRGHIDSYADLNLGARQLFNEGLWTDRAVGFRPWYWPVLPDLVTRFGRRLEEIDGRLDDPILSFLGIDDDAASVMPRHVLQFLQRGSKDTAQRQTFKHFVQRSGSGLRTLKDKQVDSDILARIAAARIGKWIDHMLLAPQDILVDAPHLLTRYPGLLSGDSSSVKNWNLSVRMTIDSAEGIQSDFLEPAVFSRRNWTSRPAWLWRRVQDLVDFSDRRSHFVRSSADQPVFCEDASRFVDRSKARPFVAEVDSPFADRWTVHPKKIASGDVGLVGAKSVAEVFENVEYRPSIRFAM